LSTKLDVIALIFELWEHSLILPKHSFVSLGKILNVLARVLHLMKLHVVSLVLKLWEHSLIFPEHTFITLCEVLNVLAGIFPQLHESFAAWSGRMLFFLIENWNWSRFVLLLSSFNFNWFVLLLISFGFDRFFFLFSSFYFDRFFFLFSSFNFDRFAHVFCKLSLIFLSVFGFRLQDFDWLILVVCGLFGRIYRNVFSFVLFNLNSCSWHISFR
jgi:hypothetical protein